MKSLSKANQRAHAKRPSTAEGSPLALWQPSAGFVHCCIESRGCRFSNLYGSCIMCDYGAGRNILPEELAEALRVQLQPFAGKLDTLLIGSYGSVFDEYEVSEQCLDVLLDFLGSFPVSSIIFETHCSTVTKERLDRIKSAIPSGVPVTIEMGFESCDSYVLQYCLNKMLDLKQLEQAMALIHEAGMLACLNVFLGAPFLCPADQIASAQKSIMWALEKGADSLVLFPANIKPFTTLKALYNCGVYQPISQWMIPALLRELSSQAMGCIGLSWYGNRNNIYQDSGFSLLPPQDCEVCHNVLFHFYQAFLQDWDSSRRMRLVEALWKKPLECACRETMMASLRDHRSPLTPEEIELIISRL